MTGEPRPDLRQRWNGIQPVAPSSRRFPYRRQCENVVREDCSSFPGRLYYDP